MLILDEYAIILAFQSAKLQKLFQMVKFYYEIFLTRL